MTEPPQESLFLPLAASREVGSHGETSRATPDAGPDAELHVRHIGSGDGPAVLMLHGSVENGRIFYTPSGRGLGPFLARAGMDVFVADLRGHGDSRPPIARGHPYGQTESITEEIPTFIEWIRRRRGDTPLHAVAHSWGGVLLLSVLARFPEFRRRFQSLTLFGSKRCVRVHNLQRTLVIDLYWMRLARWIAWGCGYLPSARLKMGSDNETLSSHDACRRWVRPGPWIDPVDGFDYGQALRTETLPRTWFIAAAHDACLGHPDDVRDLMNEVGSDATRYTVLGRTNGNLHDYDHVNMLTHPDAPRDHFPFVVDWMAGIASGPSH